ncbi:MAG: hypothetical protein ACTSU5_20000 [Promethearchaeota archaeon]
MSRDQFFSEVEGSYDNGTPFVEYTDDYIYALVPLGGGKWKEIVLMKEDDSVEESEMDSDRAFLMLMEEVEKGLPGYVEDFKVLYIKEFREGLSGSSEDKINAVIQELLTNGAKYSDNLPVVKSKDELGSIK